MRASFSCDGGPGQSTFALGLLVSISCFLEEISLGAKQGTIYRHQ